MKIHFVSPEEVEYPVGLGGDNIRPIRIIPSGVVCAALMPHAPILVPEVGGAAGDAATATRQAMREVARRVVEHRPDSLVLISPHSPRQPEAYGLWSNDPVMGSFAQFGAPQAVVSLPLDQTLTQAVTGEMKSRGVKTWAIYHLALDHGALVPLWFLAEAGWAGPVVIVSLNYSGEDRDTEVGEGIVAAAQRVSRRIAVIASGDMSHCLTTTAPCGFQMRAHLFDEAYMRILRAGDFRNLEKISPELRELAAEDVLDSTLIAAAAVKWRSDGHQVLQYESPFGVGYGVAMLFDESVEASSGYADVAGDKLGSGLPEMARRSVLAALRRGREAPPPSSGEYCALRRGVFVSIHHRDGRLRGCVGSIEPVCDHLVAETWRNARLAAFEDRRFSPVTAGELGDLRFSVSVLHPPETVASAEELNPDRYGVIVSAKDNRRGLLLPRVESIKTAGEQLRIAREKGGIGPEEPVTLQRFEVDHFAEPD